MFYAKLMTHLPTKKKDRPKLGGLPNEVQRKIYFLYIR